MSLVKKEEGIVLQTRDYGESDRIATLFLKEGGKRMAIAKKGRGSRKRFGGSLESGAVVELLYKESRDWLFLQETSLLVPSPPWRTSWDGIVIVGFCLELASKLLPEGQAFLKKFLHLKHFLTAFNRNEAMASLFQFQFDWLSLSGWHPDLEQCAICGKIWKDRQNRQTIFDHYWEHLLPSPLLSRRLLAKLF